MANLSKVWVNWSRRSHNHGIFAAIMTMGSVSLLVKFVAMFKEQLVANHFGRGNELDAFIIAFLLPAFLISITSGSLNAALIPVYICVKERQGDKEAQILLSSCTTVVAVLLIAISVLLALGVNYVVPLLTTNFSTEKRALAEHLLLLLLPIIPLSGVSTIWSAVLNAHGCFAPTALAPALVAVFTILALLMFAHAGVYALIIGNVLGFALQCAFLAFVMHRQRLPIHFQWTGLSAELRQILKQYLPVASGAVLMSSTDLVDQAMSAGLGTGSVSALNYANKIVSLVISLGAMSLGTAVLPYFSRMAAEQDFQGIKKTLTFYSRWILLTLFPLTAILILCSSGIVRVIFQYGAFSRTDTEVVAQVQSFLFLQVPFYILSILFVRLISALQKNRLLLYGNVISISVNILFNWLLSRKYGVAGIALSTSIVYGVSCLYLGVAAHYLIGRKAES